MKKRLLSLLFATASLLLSGCNNSASTKPNIEFEEAYSIAYVGEEYDFQDVLITQSGVNYKLEVYYQDFYEKKEYTLEVRDTFYFTPITTNELTVVVSATKDDASSTRTMTLEVGQKADPIDELLISTGYSGFADTGITKEIETSETYLKGEGSKTSIAVHYQGNNSWTWGCAIFSLNNFRCLKHWMDKTWDNAILTLYVYNPTEYDIEFQLRIKDAYTGIVDIDWGHTMNISQVAASGKWTQLFFSLRKVGIDHTLFVNEEGTRNDSFIIKAKWAGAPKESGNLYDYQFYADGIDIVPHTVYPEIDTKSYASRETLNYGWENVMIDSGWTSCTALFDSEVVRTAEKESRSSMFLTFDKRNPNDNGYAVIYSPEDQFKGETMPSFRHGTLQADIKFSEDITDKSLTLVAVNPNWTHIVRKAFALTDLEDGWYRLYVDLATHSEYNAISECVRYGFAFPGITTENKATAIIHIDNVVFNQKGGTPEPPEPEDPETYLNGLENLLVDTGWSSSTSQVIDTTVFKENTETMSKSSLKSSFAGATPKGDIGYATVLDPETSGITLPDCSTGTLEFDVKFFSGITDTSVRVEIVNKGWDIYGTAVTNGTADGDWYHFSLSLAEESSFASVKKAIRFAFTFPGVNAENQDNAIIYLDNVVLH